MKPDGQDKIAVPGFGFYPSDLWQTWQTSEGGPLNDSEVCDRIYEWWKDTEEEDLDQFCPPQWDGMVACVPATRKNETAVLPCVRYSRADDNSFEYYNTSYNITKRCLHDGTWESFTNYHACLNNTVPPPEAEMDWEAFIFLLGYSVSIISLLFAIFIFMYFREMKCLRHKIHLNLFVSVLSANLAWLLVYRITDYMFDDDAEPRASISTLNCILTVLLRYAALTNFFWMFVEGLYLFLQVQASFSVGRLKLRHCVSIGWGAPLLLTLLWTLLIYCQAQTDAWAGTGNGNIMVGVNTSASTVSALNCPFIHSDASNLYELYTYVVPVLLLLMSNFVFSIWIMAVVISKLRSNDVHYTVQNINLRAAKALIIIVPLLGITYIITIVGPRKSDNTLATVFILTRTCLIAFQGFFITLPYCFLNGEVCGMIRSHWDRWRDRNNIGYGPASARNSIAMQGMFGVGNDARKRSSYGYQTVTTVTTMNDDRRGTQETEVLKTNTSGGTNTNNPAEKGNGNRNWRSRDGPLVPQPDLVQQIGGGGGGINPPSS